MAQNQAKLFLLPRAFLHPTARGRPIPPPITVSRVPHGRLHTRTSHRFQYRVLPVFGLPLPLRRSSPDSIYLSIFPTVCDVSSARVPYSLWPERKLSAPPICGTLYRARSYPRPHVPSVPRGVGIRGNSTRAIFPNSKRINNEIGKRFVVIGYSDTVECFPCLC